MRKKNAIGIYIIFRGCFFEHETEIGRKSHCARWPTVKLSLVTAFVISLVVLTSCAKLPIYALPRGDVRLEDPTVLNEAFTYRQLTKADFKAPSLPQDRLPHKSSINAYTCSRIRHTRDSRITVRLARYNDSLFYISRIDEIGFEAVMIPGCSWWNPALPAGRHAYVLQHEQIHFALMELAARQLMVDTLEAARTYMTINLTIEAAKAELAATVNGWIKSAIEESLAMHTSFDEDTSLFYSPKWQKWWLEKVESQLAEMHLSSKKKD